MGITALAAGTSTYVQQQNAKETQRALNDQRKDEAEEIRAQAQTEMGARVEEARREAARRLVAAGESGVSGNSIRAVVDDPLTQLNHDLATLETQTRFNDRASQHQYAVATASNHIPSNFEIGLSTASGAASGYGAGLQIRNSRGRTKT